MTIIVAIANNNQACVGSNTGCTIAKDSLIDTGIMPWIFFQNWALGVSGSMLVLNLLRHNIVNFVEDTDNPESVMSEVRKILSDYDVGTKTEATWSYDVWCILAHRDGQIWDVDESLCLCPIPNGIFWARGSGEKYSLGAASALSSMNPNISIEDIVKHSVKAAIDNDIFCPGSIFSKIL
jgi:hypothetical protein